MSAVHGQSLDEGPGSSWTLSWEVPTPLCQEGPEAQTRPGVKLQVTGSLFWYPQGPGWTLGPHQASLGEKALVRLLPDSPVTAVCFSCLSPQDLLGLHQRGGGAAGAHPLGLQDALRGADV